MLPLWSGAIPAGVAYGIAAHSAGLRPGEVQVMSLVVFSAAAQVSAISLIEAQSSALLIAGTVIALNLQLLLLGATISRTLRLSWPGRLATAWFLTDSAYAIAAARGPLLQPVLLGAGVGMYCGWNLGTAIGLLAGNAIPNPADWGMDFIVSLAFLAVLVPLLKGRAQLGASLAAGALVLPALQFLPVGAAVLLGGVGGAIAGVCLKFSSHVESGTGK